MRTSTGDSFQPKSVVHQAASLSADVSARCALLADSFRDFREELSTMSRLITVSRFATAIVPVETQSQLRIVSFIFCLMLLIAVA
jgi:hypothetical protein